MQGAGSLTAGAASSRAALTFGTCMWRHSTAAWTSGAD